MKLSPYIPIGLLAANTIVAVSSSLPLVTKQKAYQPTAASAQLFKPKLQIILLLFFSKLGSLGYRPYMKSTVGHRDTFWFNVAIMV